MQEKEKEEVDEEKEDMTPEWQSTWEGLKTDPDQKDADCLYSDATTETHTS